MKVIVLVLLLFFLAILAIDCVFIINKMPEFRFYTKPLLMPILYIIMSIQTINTTHKTSKLYISLALFFCFAGDFILLNEGDKAYFILGLAFFLLGHISYALFFLRLKGFSIKRITNIGLISILILIYLYLVLNMLWEGIARQNLAIPVITYSLIIGFMLLTASQVAMGKRLRKLAWQNFIPGALLFIISDSLLAVDKFTIFPGKGPHNEEHITLAVIIMASYGIAQLFLNWGAIRVIKK